MPLIEGTARFWNGDDIGKMIPLITSICLVGLPLLEIYGSNRLVSYKSPFFCLAVLHMIGTLLSFLLVCDPYFQIGLTRKTFVDYSLLDPIAAKATELMVDAASFRIMAFEFFRRGVLGFILYYMSQRVEAFITMGNGKLKIALRVFTAIFIILGQVGCFISMGNAIRQVRYLFLIPSVKLPDYDYLYPFLYNGSILEILMAPWRLVLEVLTLLVSIQFATKEMRSKTVKVTAMIILTLINCLIKSRVCFVVFTTEIEDPKLYSRLIDTEVAISLYSTIRYGTNIKKLLTIVKEEQSIGIGSTTSKGKALTSGKAITSTDTK